MSKRRKDGSWQSDHHGGRVQLQPHTGLHTLQHQPEPLPTSTRAHVSPTPAAKRLGTMSIFYLKLVLSRVYLTVS